MARTTEEMATRVPQGTRGIHTRKITDHLYLVKCRKFAPGTHHEVRVDSSGHVTLCARCPGFAYHGTCAHAAAVERRLARDAKSKVTRAAPSGSPRFARPAVAVRDTEPILGTMHGARQLYRK
jgi:hypothetical protein